MLCMDLAMIGGDGVLERILFPIVQYRMIIKREKPSEAGTAENEFRYSIPGAPHKNSCIIRARKACPAFQRPSISKDNSL